MANSVIKRPLSNKPIEVTNFESSVNSSGNIEIDSVNFIGGLWITTPANAMAIKMDSTHIKVFQLTWNGSLQMMVFSELAEGTTVKGNAIYF